LASQNFSQILDALSSFETNPDVGGSHLVGQTHILQTGGQEFLGAIAENLPCENPVYERNKKGFEISVVSRVSDNSETEAENSLSRSGSNLTNIDCSKPYPGPLRPPSNPSEIFEAKYPPETFGKRNKHQKAMALCPHAQHVGYLFPDCIFVYELSAEPDASTWKVGSGFRCSLDSSVLWQHLQLAGPYLVAWGSRGSRGSSQSERRSVSYSCIAEYKIDKVITSISLNYVTSSVERILASLI